MLKNLNVVKDNEDIFELNEFNDKQKISCINFRDTEMTGDSNNRDSCSSFALRENSFLSNQDNRDSGNFVYQETNHESLMSMISKKNLIR